MIKTLVRRPRLYSQKSAKVTAKRSPKINILKAIANGLTVLSAIACLGYTLYGFYIALPHIGYGLWLMLPCIAVATILALLGASIQVLLDWDDRHE